MRRPARAVVLAMLVAMAGARIASAQPAHLPSDEAPTGPIEPNAPRIELLTFGEGARIFEKYGHAALCLIYNDPHNLPICFNYGVTDFEDTTGMIWNFLRTTQKFWVEIDPRDGMLDFYRWEDRTIYSQLLENLTNDEARAIEVALWKTTLPENKYYAYDHFFNNCTTRLRDILDAATHGRLRAGTEAPYPLTFRQLGYAGVAEYPEIPAVCDFAVGRQLDDTPTIWQSMFHPDMLRAHVATVYGAVPQELYTRVGPPFPQTGSSGRWATILAALVFGLPLVLATWRRRWQRAALAWATLELAFWGLLIWGLVIVSSIAGLRWNECVFVLVPFDIVLPWLSPAHRQGYARVRVGMIVLASLLAAIGVFHQALWVPALTAFIPLAALAFSDSGRPRT